MAELDLAARFLEQPRVHARHRDEVDDAGLRHPQPGDADGVRLVLDDLFRPQAAQAHQTVGLSAALELVEARDLLRLGRHHQLAADLVRDAVLGAQLDQSAPAGDALARLVRSRLVVETGVDDAAVVTGLMAGDVALRFEHDGADARSRAGA